MPEVGGACLDVGGDVRGAHRDDADVLEQELAIVLADLAGVEPEAVEQVERLREQRPARNRDSQLAHGRCLGRGRVPRWSARCAAARRSARTRRRAAVARTAPAARRSVRRSRSGRRRRGRRPGRSRRCSSRGCGSGPRSKMIRLGDLGREQRMDGAHPGDRGVRAVPARSSSTSGPPRRLRHAEQQLGVVGVDAERVDLCSRPTKSPSTSSVRMRSRRSGSTPRPSSSVG